MSASRAKGILAAAIVWIVIIAVLAVAYRYIFRPAKQQKLTAETSSASRYEHELRLAADSFSGYAILRSEAVREAMAAADTKLVIEDDGADYRARIEALRDGDLQMAVFTVDSYLSAGAALGEFPGAIVMVIDESKGADAIVTYAAGVDKVDDLDHAEARFVLTTNSPSEFLARVTIADFGLRDLDKDWIIAADGAEEVYQRFRKADKKARCAYVMWEPYVSQALERMGAKVLLDSSNLKGYIVDVLVAERGFLRDHPELVSALVQGYFRAAHQQRGDEALKKLVIADSKQAGGERLTSAQAEKLVGSIQWKNTLENYAHFGLIEKSQRGGLTHLEDIIRNIAKVLVQTGAWEANMIDGQEHTLFYDRILSEMQASNYHPSKSLGATTGIGPGTAELEAVRSTVELRVLSEAEWEQLIPVGEMRTNPISFGRGGARLNIQSQRELTALAERLAAWPQYYLTVIGHARAGSNPEADRRLAEERATAVVAFLENAGLEPQRLHRQAATLPGRGGAAQSVSFVVGLPPY